MIRLDWIHYTLGRAAQCRVLVAIKLSIQFSLWELDLPSSLVHGSTNIIYYLTFLVIKYTFLGLLIGGHNGSHMLETDVRPNSLQEYSPGQRDTYIKSVG